MYVASARFPTHARDLRSHTLLPRCLVMQASAAATKDAVGAYHTTVSSGIVVVAVAGVAAVFVVADEIILACADARAFAFPNTQGCACLRVFV